MPFLRAWNEETGEMLMAMDVSAEEYNAIVEILSRTRVRLPDRRWVP